MPTAERALIAMGVAALATARDLAPRPADQGAAGLVPGSTVTRICPTATPEAANDPWSGLATSRTTR